MWVKDSNTQAVHHPVPSFLSIGSFVRAPSVSRSPSLKWLKNTNSITQSAGFHASFPSCIYSRERKTMYLRDQGTFQVRRTWSTAYPSLAFYTWEDCSTEGLTNPLSQDLQYAGADLQSHLGVPGPQPVLSHIFMIVQLWKLKEADSCRKSEWTIFFFLFQCWYLIYLSE